MMMPLESTECRLWKFGVSNKKRTRDLYREDQQDTTLKVG